MWNQISRFVVPGTRREIFMYLKDNIVENNRHFMLTFPVLALQCIPTSLQEFFQHSVC